MDDLRWSKTRGFGGEKRERERWGVAWENKARDGGGREQRRERGVQSIRARVDYEKAELTRQFQPDKQTDGHAIAQSVISRCLGQSLNQSVSRTVGRSIGELAQSLVDEQTNDRVAACLLG